MEIEAGPNMTAALTLALAATQGLVMRLAGTMSPAALQDLERCLSTGGVVRIAVELPAARIAVTAEMNGDVRTLFDAPVDHRRLADVQHRTHLHTDQSTGY